MAISIDELNPRETSLEFKGNKLTLGKFTLSAQVWANSEFATEENGNGLMNLSELLAKLDGMAIGKVGFYLLKEKELYKNENDFIESFGDFYTLISTLLPGISASIGASQPELTEDEIELKK